MVDLGHKIIFGDAKRLFELIDEPVDLIVTSPPYFRIFPTGLSEEIGQDTFRQYIDDLSNVLLQCYDLLHPGCRCCVVIGDSYNSDRGYKVYPSHAEMINGAIWAGFTYLGSIIWRKISTTNTSGGGVWMGSTYYPKNGFITYENEFIAILKKPGKCPKPLPEDKEKSRLTKEERSGFFRGIWEIPGARQKTAAAFPMEIPRRLIKMFSFYGETVLDPFLGAATTMLAAEELGRRCIGVELNEEREAEIRETMKDVDILTTAPA